MTEKGKSKTVAGSVDSIKKLKSKTDFVAALAGNPNVGKSTMFNRLTGIGVVTANYPGMTVDINMGITEYSDKRVGIIDLPGTYALGAISDDQRVARRGVLEGRPEVIINIVDAGNLKRNLYMLIQFMDMGFKTVVALNLVDEAESAGIFTDALHLEELIGMPVIPTIAVRGEGVEDLISRACEIAFRADDYSLMPFKYKEDVETAIGELEKSILKNLKGLPYGLSARSIAIILLEDDEGIMGELAEMEGGENILEKFSQLSKDMESKTGEKPSVLIARQRYEIASGIADEVQKRVELHKETMGMKLWRLSTSRVTGLFMLAAVLSIVFLTLFVGGSYLSELLEGLWDSLAAEPLENLIYAIFGEGVIGEGLKWCFVDGIQATLAIVIPYILTFYLLLAVLEDTGYLNSVAMLTDRLMHRFGLHGKAVVPMLSSAGCNVPAIMGTRVLSTSRERLIACTMIVLIPCSARTAVIIGGVSQFVGWQWALLQYLIVTILIVVTGLVLNRFHKGEATGLVMEVFPFRKPSFRTVFGKTWFRMKDFIIVAMPVILIGSFALGALYETGWLFDLTGPMEPVVVWWLGLPSITGIVLIFAFLRKELALELLLTFALAVYPAMGSDASIASLMTKQQIFTFALVNTIYIPCVATLAVLWKELGWKKSITISAFTVVVALLMGGAAHGIYRIFGL